MKVFVLLFVITLWLFYGSVLVLATFGGHRPEGILPMIVSIFAALVWLAGGGVIFAIAKVFP